MNVPWHDLAGGLLFAAAVIGAVVAARWLIARVVQYEPHCVYKIPLVDGRPYYGHAKDQHVRLRRHEYYQRNLPDGHPRKWWPLVPPEVRDTRPLLMPDEWIEKWCLSKPSAKAHEERLIQDSERRGITTANRIKYKGATVAVED